MLKLFNVAIAAQLLLSCGCASQYSTGVSSIERVRARGFAPLPSVVAASGNPITQQKVALGRMLYFDPRLSRSQTLSCNSCHELTRYGVDGEPTSDGFRNQHGDRNSPSVYNAAGHFVQFWDGRAADVEEQAKGPVLNPVEMAMPSEAAVEAVLQSMPEYVAAFERAFPGDTNPVTFDNMARAIAAFERQLITPARWDKFLLGEETALSESEKAGFQTFAAAGCSVCHTGPYVGGQLFQRLGAAQPYPDTSDLGRYKVTKAECDRMVFKVPSLRNVERTAPYFHNGKIASLAEAVADMSEYQLGRTLTDQEVSSITGWLETLTGELPREYIKPPALPKSTDKTPKPDFAD